MKKRKVITLVVVMMLFIGLTACGIGDSGSGADIVFTNGLVYTVDEDMSEEESVAVKDGEIVYVGDETGVEEYIGSDTRVVDMEGGMLLPGFIDSHQHPSGVISDVVELSLSDCETEDEYIEAIEKYDEDNPDIPTIMGVGWDMPVFENIQPTKEVLDKINNEKPIVLADSGQHIKWMNSKALEKMGITADSEVPEGAKVEKTASGEPTGIVSDYPGINEKFARYDSDQYKEALQVYQEEALSYGITTSFEDMNRNFDEAVKAYKALEEEGKLKYRVSCYMRIKAGNDINEAIEKLKALKEENSEGLFRVDGAKLFIDGALEGETAYMEEAYKNDPTNHGEFAWEGKEDELKELCRKLEKKNLNYHFHAIGDKAVSVALDAIEFAKEGRQDSETRPAITHLQFVSDEDITRFGKLKVTAVIQAFWAVYDSYYEQAVELVGKELADRQYPVESLFENGITVASGSDYPVNTDRPLDAIESGITRTWPYEEEGETLQSLPPDSEKATLDQMIRSYTINGAEANYREDEVGSIKVGKKADLVLLNRNLFDIDVYQIAETEEMMTVFDGEIVFERDSK